MHLELDALLCSRYPAIFSSEGPNDLFGFECGDGWFPLIDGACDAIQRYIDSSGTPQLIASQVKEKFGALRFYCRNSDEHASAALVLAESLSAHVCEVCGAVGKPISLFGWMQTRCVAHGSTTRYEEPLMQGVRENLLQVPPMGALFDASLEFFDRNGHSAATWLSRPAFALGNVAPLEMATGSLDGQHEVLTLIGRLEHGVLV